MIDFNNTIINGDCFHVFPHIPDHSVDLILADPPFNILENFAWDQIPINLELFWQHAFRILTENGVIALFCAEPFTSKLVLSNLNAFQYKWVWEKCKAANFMQCHKRPQNNYEEIAVFYTTTNPIYNPQMKERTSESGIKRVLLAKKRVKNQKPEMRIRSSDVSAKLHKPIPNGCDKLNANEKYPTLVITDINPLNPTDSERVNHPTQKPIRLYEYFIKTYTNPKMMVLDCFAGSGTNLMACLKTNRRYCCIENNPDYIQMILNRVKTYNHSIQFQKTIYDSFTMYQPQFYFESIGLMKS